MAAVIQKVAVQSLKTFSHHGPFRENFQQLKLLVNQLTASDINFDHSLVSNSQVYQPKSEMTPITYIDMFENDAVSMGVFVLKNGASLPLHDHPGMHGIIKVISGCIRLTSFSELKDVIIPDQIKEQLRPWQHHLVKGTRKHADLLIDYKEDACALTPTDGNYHSISSVNGPAAFIDILSPPYDHDTGSRKCHYYKEVSIEEKVETDECKGNLHDIRYIIQIPQPPDFYGDSAEYTGPDINPYEEYR